MDPGPLAQVRHLVRRFFGHVFARPLAPSEQAEARSFLTDAEADWFFRQDHADQRHALEVARRVLSERPEAHEAIEAALLHDIGKVCAQLGPVARAMATMLDAMGVPLRGRFAAYRRHGELGADVLQQVGASRFAVAFTRMHPGPVPAGIDSSLWHVVESADRA